MSEKKSPETFEEGLGRLETIVGLLESRNLSLDQAVAAFEQGMRLSEELGKKLSAAEAKLETISKTSEGRVATPMAPPKPAAMAQPISAPPWPAVGNAPDEDDPDEYDPDEDEGWEDDPEEDD